MSDSVQPHRRQPTRLCCPWDSPGKNSGVGCHFLLQCMKVKSKSEVAQSCLTLSNPMDCSLPGSSVHGICQARVLEWAAIAFSDIHTHMYVYMYIYIFFFIFFSIIVYYKWFVFEIWISSIRLKTCLAARRTVHFLWNNSAYCCFHPLCSDFQVSFPLFPHSWLWGLDFRVGDEASLWFSCQFLK